MCEHIWMNWCWHNEEPFKGVEVCLLCEELHVDRDTLQGTLTFLRIMTKAMS